MSNSTEQKPRYTPITDEMMRETLGRELTDDTVSHLLATPENAKRLQEALQRANLDLGSRLRPVTPVAGFLMLTRVGRRPAVINDDGSFFVFDLADGEWHEFSPVPNSTEYWRQFAEEEAIEADRTDSASSSRSFANRRV